MRSLARVRAERSEPALRLFATTRRAKSAAMSNPDRIFTAIYIQTLKPRLTRGFFVSAEVKWEGEQDFVPDKVWAAASLQAQDFVPDKS